MVEGSYSYAQSGFEAREQTIYPFNNSGEVEPISAKNLLQSAIKASEKFCAARTATNTCGRLRRLCCRVVDQLRRHTTSIDVVIQHQPQFTVLVWGTIRLILHLIVDKEEASEIALKGVIEIVSNIDRWNKAAARSHTRPGIQKAVLHVFCEILGFLTGAKKHLEVGSLKRFSQSVKSSQKEKFQHSLDRLRDAAQSLKLKFEAEFIHYTENWFVVRRWLESALDDAHGEHNEPTPGTTEWISSNFNPLYHKLIEEGHNRLLLFEGPPGCGKSYIAKSLATTLKNRDTTAAVVSCQFSSQRGPSKLSACILFWLLRKSQSNSATTPLVNKLAELACTNRLRPSEGQSKALWKIVLEASQVLVPKSRASVFIIIDSLEQYQFKPASSISSFFEGLQELLAMSKNTRIAIFTRPRVQFASLSAASLKIRLTPDVLASNIKVFATKKFEELGIPKTLMDAAIDKIRVDAAGSFQYANMLLEQLTTPELQRDFFHRRLAILRLVWAAQKPLTVTELARAVQLGDYNSYTWISQYCDPIITLEDGRVQFIHSSVAEFLTDAARTPAELGSRNGDSLHTVRFHPQDAHTELGLQCLQALLDPEYASKGRIGQLLHHNFWEAVEVKPHPKPQRGVSFEYAAQYWDFHLTAISDPPDSLVSLANDFLHVPNFVFWAEWSVHKLQGSISRSSTVLSSLKLWSGALLPEKSSLLELTDYFTSPYQALASSYRDSSDSDKVLQYLPLMRLGRFYVDIGCTHLATPLRREAASGLTEVLGTEHPLTLLSRTDLAYTLILEESYSEANEEFSAIVRVEEIVLGKDNQEFYRTLQARGETELYLNRYEESLVTQREVAEGYARLLGEDSKAHLGVRLWIARPLVQFGRLEEAERIYADVFKKRRDKFGPDDLFAASAGFSLGQAERQIGRLKQALERLEDAYRVRSQLGLGNFVWALDFAIELVIAYREVGESKKARELLNEVEDKSGVGLGTEKWLVKRYFQVVHLKGLLLWDAGECDKAANLVQDLVIQIERAEYNRAVLWIILDLAKMLRLRGGEGDERLAEANFNQILVDNSDESSHCIQSDGGSDDGKYSEPDLPRLLKLAERALGLVRVRKFDEVEYLLEQEKVGWFRDEDLWLWFGGPSADTTRMKPPRERYQVLTTTGNPETERTNNGSGGVISDIWAASSGAISKAAGAFLEDWSHWRGPLTGLSEILWSDRGDEPTLRSQPHPQTSTAVDDVQSDVD
ncbi:hypothetical protein QBC43DRAFT_303780 [Cladorrhinum sp. PSN259]|nr:hypothetical protein QBC43DRAFT_303780 [Cladorrhinum sp. PSN259]